MKWYSVKKYKIPGNSSYIFVALSVEELCVFEMAKYTYCNKTDDFRWINEDGEILSQVTHFCIPDPIEIDD